VAGGRGAGCLLAGSGVPADSRRTWRIAACRAGGGQRSPGRTGIAKVSVPKVAPLPVQSVTAAQVLSPDPGAPASLWQWLARLPDPRDPRGARFSVACVIAVALAARLAGCDSFTAAGEWAASRPQRVLKALGCPRHKRAALRVAPSEKTIRRVSGLIDHDLADDLLCGHAAELAAACVVLSAAKLQERRRDKARKARRKARKAARRARGARELSGKQARKAARRERKAAAAAVAASAAAVAGGRAKLPAGSAFGRVAIPAGHPAFPAAAYGDPRHVPALRGLGADGKASRGARLKGQEAPQHLGFSWHGSRLNAARRGVDKKTNETTVIGPVIDQVDLAGVCLTVDALHSLVDLNRRVLARGGHVIFVIKGNQPRTYQALDDIAWDQVPVTAATFEADRGRIETRSIQVAAAPEGLKYPGMEQAALIERYTTSKDKEGKAVTRSETVLILTTASADEASPADLLALNRGHWAATEATHYIRDIDLKEDSSRARGPGAARFMATVGNAVLNLLRIHGVTNIVAERRRLNGSDRQILKRMGLSTG
jgi:predicted transposase YbfD/YdcC